MTIDPALVAQLVNDAKGPDTLPPMALTMERLYTKYASTGQLTLANYKSKSIGGMREVVNNEIEQILPRDPHERETALGALRAAFIPSLVEITDSGRFVRRRAHESDLPADSRALIDALVEKRLLVRDRERDGHVVVEVALESLFEHWDALKGWLDEHTEDLKTVADIKRSAAGWGTHERDPYWLLKGTRLADAEKLARTPQFSSRIADDSDFLAASRRAEDKTAATERKRRRVLTAALVATAIVAVVAVVGFVQATHAKHQADERTREAIALRLDAEAKALLVGGERGGEVLAIQLILAAPRIAPAADTGLMFTEVVAARDTLKIIPTSDAVRSVAFSPDGRRIVSGSYDRTLRLWDAATGQPIEAPLTGHTDVVRSVAFSPDGRRIVSGSNDRTVRLWDAATGRPIGQPLIGHEGHVTSVAFSPDGRASCPAATTAPCGCGTPPPAQPSASR